jgi:hypothetical protein
VAEFVEGDDEHLRVGVSRDLLHGVLQV